MKFQHLICPIDGLPLVNSGSTLACDNGHRFDIARQGYINLLPVQNKRSKQPGDSKAMVQARREFLDAGYYQSIAEAVTEQVAGLLNTAYSQPPVLLDAGCGDGYYLDQLYQRLPGQLATPCYGLDISKWAVREAAKRNKQIEWLVASNRQPPLPADHIDLVLCMFGFISAEGFSQVLKPGGYLLLVEPGPAHLQQLKQVIYDEQRTLRPRDYTKLEQKGFVRAASVTHQAEITLPNQTAIQQLMLMTPHLFRASQQGKTRLASLSQLALDVDIELMLFRYQPD